MILAVRTDKPEAELYILDRGTELASVSWLAHRELSDTLLVKIEELLVAQGASLSHLTGLIVFRGPGSFTGLRIGVAAMNALAYSLGIPIAGATGNGWLQVGQAILDSQDTYGHVTPLYGSAAKVTKPRK